MKSYYALAVFALLAVTACTPTGEFHHEYASGHYESSVQQCAIYARGVSGLRLFGDAGGWWDQAAGRYQRGHIPERGAVLVLKHTSSMRSGHVAVVKDVISRRQVNVTHSNWGSSRSSRHIIYESMRIEDVSPANNWTQVRFWNDEKNVFGFAYAAYGFIYP